ncbi:MAG: hypothetical protein HYY15_02030 [Candidatus Omnitrophica bacterium]|nr:hypothetical protein [Candidatus Omnitrophota bacterium]
MDYLPSTPLAHAVRRLSAQELCRRLADVRRVSEARGLRVLGSGGRPQPIDLAFRPWILTAVQVAHFQRVVHQMVDALRRIPVLYTRHAAIREMIPLAPAQEAWTRLAEPLDRRPFAVLGRLDATATFDHPDWRRGFRFLEPNTVGVGGVYYAPASCRVMLDVLGDLLRRAYPRRRFEPMPDPSRMLAEEIRAMAPGARRVALLENRDFTTGTDEFGNLAHSLRREGLEAVVADPRELRLSGGRMLAPGGPVDALYRDCELGELLEMEARGPRLAAVRHAVRTGRLLSGIAWEFDHKSCWEVLTDARYAAAFTPAQRRLFRAHVPWTRLVRQAVVRDPHGHPADLVPYIRRHQSQLVLKPNTLYGGEGVVVGRRVTRAVWERTVATALRAARVHYVVQQAARIRTERFPLLRRRPETAPRNVVSGFFFNSRRIGLMGRFSDDPVVNVSRGGGLIAALQVK